MAVQKYDIPKLEEDGGGFGKNIGVHRLNSLPPVNADETMMKQVWINLITNALKYSRNKEKRDIEIGCSNANGTLTSYIKDNGIGFGMQYYEKLFGAFQRLPRVNEFEGTG